MTKLSRPPSWKDSLKPEFISKAFDSPALREMVRNADREYIYWDKFKYLKPPPDFTIKEAWLFLKLSRLSNQESSPVKSIDGVDFHFNVTKTMSQKLSFIDSNMSGFLGGEYKKPSGAQKNQLLISSLSEEAIASSQIEGANTSRKVAKEMILSQRKPRTTSEQMIINNYQVMQRLMDWKDLPLSTEMLLDIQKNITTKTLDNEADSGRFRTDEDGIKVINSLTGEIVFTPPDSQIMLKELDRLIEFANKTEVEDNFVHPVIKASILHFWLAYLHPFVDGNGRTARALFYWYLLKHNYWLFQYLSVSRIIRKNKKQYEDAFLRSEMDESNLTYFLIYKLKVVLTAYEKFFDHYTKRLEKDKDIAKMAHKLKGFNERQITLLQYLDDNKDKTLDINTHRNKWRVAYETARTDIQDLEKKGFLTAIADGKKYYYVPNTIMIRDLFAKS